MLKRICQFITHLFKSIWFFGPGILSVIASYFILIELSMGQDMVIQIGEFYGPLALTIFCTIIWSFFAWYSARLVGYQKKAVGSRIPDRYHKHIPRLIAYNAVVSVQAAVLALPTMLDLSTLQIWFFIALQNVLYFFLSHIITNGASNIAQRVIVCILISGYCILLVWLIINNISVDDYLRHQRRLPIACLLLFCTQLFLIWLFIKRRIWLQSKAVEVPSSKHIKIFGRNVIAVPAAEQKVEQAFFNVFNSIALAGIMVYGCTTFSVAFADRMGPIAFTLVAFGILVGFANIITYFSIRLNINLYVFILLLALLVGMFYDPYKVRLIPNKQYVDYSTRPNLKTYFESWVLHRSTAIERSASFPVYLFLADGGASRSGYWVASVLASWEDGSRVLTGNDSLSGHTFCLSGTSGGGVGNATYYALLKAKLAEKNVLTLWRSQKFLGSDFLTFTLAHYLGPDFLRHIVPLPILDRAAALENVMGEKSAQYLYNMFEQPLHEIFDYSGKLPILFINTTEVQEGSPAVISSIRTTDFTHRLDVLSFINGKGLKHKNDLRLSTAVILGARFPYVSPAGSINDKYFVDGGYFDNSGAGVVHEMMQRLEVIMEQTTDVKLQSLYNKLCFKLVHISNTPANSSGSKSLHPLKNDAAAPLVTVLNTYTSQTTVNDQRLNQFMERFEYGQVEPEVNLFTEKDTVTYPMNWVISDYNLERMNQRLHRVIKDLKSRGEINLLQ